MIVFTSFISIAFKIVICHLRRNSHIHTETQSIFFVLNVDGEISELRRNYASFSTL